MLRTFINKKRKRTAEADEEDEIKIVRVVEPPAQRRRVITWLKENVVDKIKKTFVTTSGPSITETCTLFNTPENEKRVRYSMTPHNLTSPSGIERRSWYELDSYIPLTENKTTEFKAGSGRYPKDILPKHIRKYGCGFLNSCGGVLLVGICDDGRVQGIYCRPYEKSDIVKLVTNEFKKFQPAVTSSMFGINFFGVTRRQTSWEQARGYRDFIPECYVLEISIQAGQPGEIYEDSLHQVFIRREGSVEGPLNPLQIKDLVLSKYRKLLEDRKRRREDDEIDPPTKHARLEYSP
ncbi:schlafen-like protein 1 [Nematostella vectensis]|uniref:schlafen-like protein 1 n=1 Tax=Nematostella vectensis TaxID=45351 RepID=UPI001390630A|nr:schlafen-like protein 1 [Nematostella vectensis]